MKTIVNQFTDLKEGKLSQSQFMRNVRMTLPQYVTNVTSFQDTVKILKNKGILTEGCDIDILNGHEVLLGLRTEEGETPGKTKHEYEKIISKNLKKDSHYYTNYKLTGKRGDGPITQGSTKEGSDQMQPLTKSKDNLVDKANQQKVTIPNAKASSNKSKKETEISVEVDIMAVTSKALRGVQKLEPVKEQSKVIKESKIKEDLKIRLKEVITKMMNESTEKKIKIGDKVKLTKDDASLGKQRDEFLVTIKNLDKLKSSPGSYIITYKS